MSYRKIGQCVIGETSRMVDDPGLELRKVLGQLGDVVLGRVVDHLELGGAPGRFIAVDWVTHIV